MAKFLTRNIWLLSIVSLFNDVSSEMLYPVLPLFLQEIGFSSVLIGFLEGAAEATSGLTKGYFGRVSDSSGRRLPFVQLGYLLSGLAKSGMVLFTFPLWVFGTRSMDRFGKGLRTGARDAMLSDEATSENKGSVFGFHRAMDTLGAAIGPSFALVFIYYFPQQYRTLFLIAFIPAMLGTGLTLLLKEKPHKKDKKTNFHLSQIFNYWGESTAGYKKAAALLLLFALFNSSDIFLLMRIKEVVHNDTYVIAAYILYNLVYALAAFPLGHLADRIGLRVTLVAGFGIFALVYAGFGFASLTWHFVIAFILYGVYAAATEGVGKALLSNLVPKSQSASALGTFAGFNSISALFASIIAGLLWKYFSPMSMLLFSAAGALLVALLLGLTPLTEKTDQ